MITALSHEKPVIRKEAAASLGRLGTKASIAVPDLVKLLQDDILDIRTTAIASLEMKAVDNPAAITELNNLLANLKILPRDSRRRSARPDGGQSQKRSLPAPHRLVPGRNGLQKTVAAWAIVHIAPNADNIKMAIPLLIEALNKLPLDSEVRVEAASTLGLIGKGLQPPRQTP